MPEEGGASGTAGGAGVPPQPLFLAEANLEALSLVQRSFILTIRSFDAIITATTTGEEVRAMVAEAFPPTSLFDADLAAFPPVYMRLRDWLNRRGAAIGTHPSRKIVNALANRLYDFEDDREEAKELARVLLQRRVALNSGAGSIASQGNSSDAPRSSGSGGGQSARHIQGISGRYKEERAKYSGGVEQSLSEYLSDYEQICDDYGLDNDQRLQYLHYLFGGEAKRFYDQRIHRQVATFGEALARMGAQYDNETRQTAVRNELVGLSMEEMVGNGYTERQALEHVYQTISKLSPQMPPAYRDDTHKRDFLRSAAANMPWAIPPMSRISTNQLSFQQLYMELVSALQLKKEFDPSGAQDSAGSRGKQVLFEGQGMYGRPVKGIGATQSGKPKGVSDKGASPRKRFNPLSVAGCFNCDEPSHTMRNCPLPIDAIKAAKRKVAYYDKKAGAGRASTALVLYQLCVEVNGCVEEDEPGFEEVLVSESTGKALAMFGESSIIPPPPAGVLYNEGRGPSDGDKAPPQEAGFALGE